VYVWEGDKAVPLAVRGTTVRPHPTRPVVAVHSGSEWAVFDVDGGRVLLSAKGSGWIDFSPDGGVLLAADGPLVRLYDTARWQPAGELRGHTDDVACGVFSPDGGTLYTGSADKTLGVWDWKGRVLRDQWKRELGVLNLSMSADGKTLFETRAGQLWVTDTSGNSRRLTDVTGPRPPFLPTAFPGLYLTTSVSDVVLLRTIDPGEPARVFRGHTGAVYTVCVSPDGRRAITGGEDGTARVWDLSASPEYAELASGLKQAAPVLSADGRRVALVCRELYGTQDEPLPVLDAVSGRELYRKHGAGDADFDPKGRWLAVGRLNGDVVLLDPENGAERRVLSAGKQTVCQVRFSRDAGRLAAAWPTGPVRVWDTTTWEHTDFTQTGDRFVRALAWSPDGTRMAVAVGEEVWMWEPATGEVGARLRPAGVPLVCAFTPDGKWLAVAGRGRSLELFELDSYRTLTFIGNPSVVHGLAFHPKGNRLASVGENGLVRVWDTASGKEVLTLNGGAELHGVAWSPDGRHLYAGGSTLRRWTGGE
jgi:WD40 repeat protein